MKCWTSTPQAPAPRAKGRMRLPMLPQVAMMTASIARAGTIRMTVRSMAYFTPSTMPFAMPTRPCISLGMMILVA